VKELVTRIINRVVGFFIIGQAVEQKGCAPREFLDQVRDAHSEWCSALNRFNYCTEADIIDFAVYNLSAAEKRYTYFIKKARKENITADLPLGSVEYEICAWDNQKSGTDSGEV